MTRNKRNPFPDSLPGKPVLPRPMNQIQTVDGTFGFFREYVVRETIESILVAIMLAFIFRMFLAEAFVIPTGSMAPSLKGAHKEITCDQSEFRYAVGASEEQRPVPDLQRGPNRIVATFCPITQHETRIHKNVAEHRSYSGDRILVNKYIYDFQEPQRFDVIVFKNPNNGKQNYIKRLIGLPGDNILIENGDIYLMHSQADGSWRREIARKPAEKIHNTLQVVDDTFHIGSALKDLGWPLRWQQYRGERKWVAVEVDGNPTYSSTDAGDSGWLRYRHFRPRRMDWPDSIDKENLPLPYRDPDKRPAGALISDSYGYNNYWTSYDQQDLEDQRYPFRQQAARNKLSSMEGQHWVGDLGVQVDVDVKSQQGNLLLDLVEGGAHFTCELDVATGVARFSCDDPKVKFVNASGTANSPTGSTSVRGAGRYQILFVNADDRLHLWVDGRLVEIDGADYERSDVPIPQFSENDPGDAEPAGIATRNLEVNLLRLQILRDLYYSSVRGNSNLGSASNETGTPETLIHTIFENPRLWKSADALQLFQAKKGQAEPMFRLQKGATREKDQFLPMGDNSPQSLDGRIWDGPNYFERDLLIGRAIFVYFPRFTRLGEVIPFPNFKDMRFIR